MINILPGLAVAVMHPLYYLALQVAIETGASSTVATYTARISTLIFFSLLLFYSLKNGKLKARWSLLHLSLLIFMLMYLYRIYVLNDEQTWNLDSEFYPYSKVFPLFLFGVIAPCFLCLLSSTLFNRPSTSRIFIFSTFVSVVGLTLMNLDQFGTFRVEGIEAGSIASLAMGYMAALGIGYCLLDFLRLKQYPRVMLILVLGCCIFLIAVSASRGPLLATLASVVYIFLTMEKSFKNILNGSALVIAIVVLGLAYLEFSGSGLLTRIENATTAAAAGEDADPRLFLYDQSIAVIQENFPWGKDIALENGYWPHNYVLEATMAVGIFSIFLIIPWLVALFKIFFYSKSDNNQWLNLWLLQTSVMNMFTEAIWSGSSLFICLFLVLGTRSNEIPQRRTRRTKKRKNTSGRTRRSRGRKPAPSPTS